MGLGANIELLGTETQQGSRNVVMRGAWGALEEQKDGGQKAQVPQWTIF